MTNISHEKSSGNVFADLGFNSDATVPRGRMDSVTIDNLPAWLDALGRRVGIHVRPYDRKAKSGQLVISP